MFFKLVITSFILLPFLLFFSVKPEKNLLIFNEEKTISESIVENKEDLPGCGCNKVKKLITLPIAKEKEIIKTELNNDLILDSKAVAVVDIDKQQLLYQKNVEQKFPIASLTKLMTAIIFNELDVDLEKEIIFSEEDEQELKNYFSPGESIGKLYISPGDKVKVKDLLYSSLIGSANNATLALVRSTGLNMKEFVKRMNEQAQVLGLKNTFFKEPTGLDPGNVSTDLEVARLAEYAFANDLIKEITTTAKYSFQTINTKEWHTIINTNWLINSLPGLFGSKTGYLEEAGCCIAVGVRNNNRNFIVVLLGAKDSKTRFEELKKIIDWALK